MITTDFISSIKNKKNISCSGFSGSSEAYLISKIFHQYKQNIVVVFDNIKEAQSFIEDITFFLESGDNILYFPQYNTINSETISYHNVTASLRIKVLYNLLNSAKKYIIVTTKEAILKKIINKKALVSYAELIMVDEELNSTNIHQKLIMGGYEKASLVEEEGDFCVRGGIIDIFSPLYESPIRIELFGDLVESIRFFSPIDQRSVKDISEAIILPARECIINSDNLPYTLDKVKEVALKTDVPKSKVKEIVEKLKEGMIPPEISNLPPIMYEELNVFFDYLNSDTLLFFSDSFKIQSDLDKIEEITEKNFLTAKQEKRVSLPFEELYINKTKLDTHLNKFQKIVFSIFKQNEEEYDINFNFNIKDNANLSYKVKNIHTNDNFLEPLHSTILKNTKKGIKTFIVLSSKKQLKALSDLLIPYGIEFSFVEKISDASLSKKKNFLIIGQVNEGFIFEEEKIAIISENEIFGTKKKIRKEKKSIKSEVIDIDTIEENDFVVHNEHGIGLYKGIKKLNVDDIINDFILILYKDDDKLYIPIDNFSVIQKYIGVSGINPILNKIGSVKWNEVKKKAKKDAEKIANDLLKTYAERNLEKGFSFSKTDTLFENFEAEFEYEETPDQLKAIKDVIEDMESEKCMDRMICGDVGFGKTEIALRACFKAIYDNRQVAIVAPTTILTEQHFRTFKKRFKKYPITIECLNRFKNKPTQKKIVEKIAEGQVDIAIGTHRLLQKDIKFKRLGLLIIDEEQKFGVKDKERLKSKKRTIDVLTLTATPIPRTLHLSMMGLKNISLISTPPAERQPVISYFSEFSENTIVSASNKEKKRGGQIFFVHNEIKTIISIFERLKKLLPDIKIGLAHGQMNEAELENSVFDFINKKLDMLVTTTIIESGIDIGSANTLFINNADKLGLSQIHQLKGRIGRSFEQAFAYFFIREKDKLTQNAKKRIKVLMEYTGLGSGFKVAMRDMQIRGGGSVLGVSQSGKIGSVGYNMFIKLVEDVMSEIKGEKKTEPLEPKIDFFLSSYIPETYIENTEERLFFYKKLSGVNSLSEIKEVQEEMQDRYGKIPEESKNIMLKIMLRVLSKKAGIKKLELTWDSLKLQFSEIHQKRPEEIVNILESDKQNIYSLSPPNNFTANFRKIKGKNRILLKTKEILTEISNLVN